MFSKDIQRDMYFCPIVLDSDGMFAVMSFSQSPTGRRFQRQEVLFDEERGCFSTERGVPVARLAESLFCQDKEPCLIATKANDSAPDSTAIVAAAAMTSAEIFRNPRVLPYGQDIIFGNDKMAVKAGMLAQHFISHLPLGEARLFYCVSNVFADLYGRAYLWDPAVRRLRWCSPGDSLCFTGNGRQIVTTLKNVGYSIHSGCGHKQAWHRLVMIAGWPLDMKLFFFSRRDIDVHHKDGNSINCCLHNLEILNPAAHRAQHFLRGPPDPAFFADIHTFIPNPAPPLIKRRNMAFCGLTTRSPGNWAGSAVPSPLPPRDRPRLGPFIIHRPPACPVPAHVLDTDSNFPTQADPSDASADSTPISPVCSEQDLDNQILWGLLDEAEKAEYEHDSAAVLCGISV